MPYRKIRNFGVETSVLGLKQGYVLVLTLYLVRNPTPRCNQIVSFVKVLLGKKVTDQIHLLSLTLR